jgi:hypothetical protein
MESPSRSRGTGAGASIFGTARDNALMLGAILRYEFVFRCGLSRGGEADVWRADYAVLLHLHLQII